MHVTVLGGSGRAGAPLVAALRARGHTVVAASRSAGVDLTTGVGVGQALATSEAIIDATNLPERASAGGFFEAVARNVLREEAALPHRHHVVLSIVGCDRMDSEYMRAKVLQESLVRSSRVPYTIARATQFFEFLEDIAAAHARDQLVRLPAAQFQPVAVGDVAELLADIVERPPVNGVVELAGPRAMPMADAIRQVLSAKKDARTVMADPDARYFGAVVQRETLVPTSGARLGATRLEDWLAQ